MGQALKSQYPWAYALRKVAQAIPGHLEVQTSHSPLLTSFRFILLRFTFSWHHPVFHHQHPGEVWEVLPSTGGLREPPLSSRLSAAVRPLCWSFPSAA